MPSFLKDDLRLCTLITANGSRFLIAEFIDENNVWSMGFFQFINGRYELVNLPDGFVPSHELSHYLWGELATEDEPPLAVPGGYFYGDQFHTVEAVLKDTDPLPGEIIDQVCGPDGKNYNLVVSVEAGARFAYFGVYVGTMNADTPDEYDLWKPTPVPSVLQRDKGMMFDIYGAVDMADATLMEFTDKIH